MDAPKSAKLLSKKLSHIRQQLISIANLLPDDVDEACMIQIHQPLRVYLSYVAMKRKIMKPGTTFTCTFESEQDLSPERYVLLASFEKNYCSER